MKSLWGSREVQDVREMETSAKESFSQPTGPAQERGHVGSNRRARGAGLSRPFGCHIMIPHALDTRHEVTGCNVHPTWFSALPWSCPSFLYPHSLWNESVYSVLPLLWNSVTFLILKIPFINCVCVRERGGREAGGTSEILARASCEELLTFALISVVLRTADCKSGRR